MFAVTDFSDQQIESQTLLFTDALALIDAQLEEGSYLEQLYYVISDDGIHRLLIINNPEGRIVNRGILSLGGRVVVGFERGFPNSWMDEIKQHFAARGIKGGAYFGGTLNGQTIFEIFGY